MSCLISQFLHIILCYVIFRPRLRGLSKLSTPLKSVSPPLCLAHLPQIKTRWILRKSLKMYNNMSWKCWRCSWRIGINWVLASNYRVHSCCTNIKKFTILYQGPGIWNCLPASVTNLSSFSVFKNKVLEFLLK